MKDLIVVIPTYNEEACIHEVISMWTTYFDEKCINYQMIVVNDGSKDKTGEILNSLADKNQNLKIIHSENRGHGQALLLSLSEALKESSEWIFHVDSDNQFIPSDFIKLWEQREKYSFIIGTRSNRQDAWYRLMITKIMRTLVWFLTSFNIQDPNSPYRLIKTKDLQSLLREIPKTVFAPNIFLSVLSSFRGQPPLFIPVKHIERKTGVVSILRFRLLKACFVTAFDLIVFCIIKRCSKTKVALL